MKAQILEIVKQKHISSNGMCGTYFADITNQLQVPAAEFDKVITEMYNNEEVDIRMGINGFMIMKKINKNPTQK